MVSTLHEHMTQKCNLNVYRTHKKKIIILKTFNISDKTDTKKKLCEFNNVVNK